VLNRLRKLLGKAAQGHKLHAPFHVTRHGHIVQTFLSLEAALDAAESLGPDHYVIDRHGLQIWNPQRKLLRNEDPLVAANIAKPADLLRPVEGT
jgi:hypothetical protein